jgi:hypothetical protein
VALIGGMTPSAIHRRSFALPSPSASQVSRHASAGWPMGVDVAMLPGGNDTLLLFGDPDAVLAGGCRLRRAAGRHSDRALGDAVCPSARRGACMKRS